jgi:hypothetical protein
MILIGIFCGVAASLKRNKKTLKATIEISNAIVIYQKAHSAQVIAICCIIG